MTVLASPKQYLFCDFVSYVFLGSSLEYPIIFGYFGDKY